MSLVITGGKFKGQKLKTTKNFFIRPTSSKLREAVFNICQHQIKKAFFLDLFAGYGSMGIEALSRGASFAAFVDKSKIAIRSIRQNLELLHLQKCSQVIYGDVFLSLKKLKDSFDIVYIDPPYHFFHEEFLKELLEKVQQHHLFQKEASIFVEGPFLQQVSVKNVVYIDGKKYGKSFLHCYRFQKSF